MTNCCYTADAVLGLLTILLKGENATAYNIANPAASVTIKQMAETVAQVLGDGNISVVVQIPDDIRERGYAPTTTTRLNADKLKALGWLPRYNLSEMYQRMAGDFQDSPVSL